VEAVFSGTLPKDKLEGVTDKVVSLCAAETNGNNNTSTNNLFISVTSLS
jgi:hypothetical protein